jgi:hypothetical protein
MVCELRSCQVASSGSVRSTASGSSTSRTTPRGTGARRAIAQLAIAGRTIAVCAMLGDKDVESVIGELRGAVDLWYAAGTDGARGLTASELAARAASARVAMQTSSDLGAAMHDAMTVATPNDRIIVFGSFHTVDPRSSGCVLTRVRPIAGCERLSACRPYNRCMDQHSRPA